MKESLINELEQWGTKFWEGAETRLQKACPYLTWWRGKRKRHQWLGKRIWRIKAEESSHSEIKPAIHRPQKTWWKFLAGNCDTHRAHDLEITPNFAFPVSKLPSAEDTAWLQSDRGRNRKATYSPPQAKLEFPRIQGGFWEKLKCMCGAGCRRGFSRANYVTIRSCSKGLGTGH